MHVLIVSVLIKKPKLFNGQNGQLLTLDSRRRESFNLILIEAIEGIVFRPQGGCPDHVPYIVIWCDLVQNPPSWVKSFLPRQVKFLTAAECSPPDASQPRQTTLAKFLTHTGSPSCVPASLADSQHPCLRGAVWELEARRTGAAC